MDAFLWLLFGKESTDRTAFEAKHINAIGNGAPKDVEVEGVLMVDHQEETLKRIFREKWVKKRGSATSEFSGHETILFFNEVPVTLREYQDKIAAICGEIISHAKKYSKSYEYATSAWQTEFDAMAKKTVIRNLLSHYGYLSVEMVGAIDEDIRSDTQYRDQEVREHTGKKTFDIEKVEFEEVQVDNGGEDDSEEGYHEDPGF